jgi:uncharacterized protein
VKETFRAVPLQDVRLLPGLFQQRYDLNRSYVMSLKNENLLQNYYQEAGLWGPRAHPDDCHWGWEAPTCQLRGHFLGHWLSAAARLYVTSGDSEAKAKADRIVAELGRCQKENGGEWAGSIPPVYLDWVARKKSVWAPHYTVHKTLMGLWEMYALAGNTQALDIMIKWAAWFSRWTEQFTRAQLDDILEVETGGMLEVWANLYGATGKQEHLDLLLRYDRPRLFDRLLAGEDPLTNMHANTTIPEAQGAARAWEVTGESRWRKIVEAYWKRAVTERGYYCSGGQTEGEIWTPPFELAARLGDKNQEHCVVYNMMRLAEYLLRWTGDVAYADYWERNLYNGILAQQHPQTGMITYFLPFEPGAKKTWGTPTEDFWCCHGSLVQAHPMHGSTAYYEDDEGLVACQYIPTTLAWKHGGTAIQIKQEWNAQRGAKHRPTSLAIDMTIDCERPVEFTLKLRLPSWLAGTATLAINKRMETIDRANRTLHSIKRRWSHDRLHLELPRSLWTDALPDEQDTVAFMDGPVVLAGLCDGERRLHGDVAHPESLLKPDNEREWGTWLHGYRAAGQERGLRFVPLYEVVDQRYSVYFPVKA